MNKHKATQLISLRFCLFAINHDHKAKLTEVRWNVTRYAFLRHPVGSI